ncbi:putative portal protein [Edwardsiella phage vB_EpM_ZHS]|nr:putative portal protein [Edwardsiella phage vB_EpM_ZHS]
MKQIHIHLHRHATQDTNWEESKHPRASNGKFGKGGGKADAKATAKAFAELKSHPNYSEADFTYLKDKGYSPDEIRAIWDRDRKAGHGPQLGNKNSAENKHHMQQIGKAMGLGRK